MAEQRDLDPVSAYLARNRRASVTLRSALASGDIARLRLVFRAPPEMSDEDLTRYIEFVLAEEEERNRRLAFYARRFYEQLQLRAARPEVRPQRKFRARRHGRSVRTTVRRARAPSGSQDGPPLPADLDLAGSAA
jgi:hypothetical protein